MKKVIGIDLGTTNSVVAFKTKDVEVLRNVEGDESTKSCVGYRKGEILVGRNAFQLRKRDPQNTILSVKRLMGGAFKDETVQSMILETKKTRGYYKYSITRLKGGTGDAVAVILGGKQYTPEQISAEILKKLKRDAELRLNDEVTHAVITVPAYFTEKQKYATRLAAKYAGLKVLKILAEPTAAVIAYGVDNLKTGEAKTILIYDLGGGTFDLSVFNIIDGQYMEMGTGGDRWLGGDDIDKVLTEYIYKKTCQQYGLDDIDSLINNLPEKSRHKFLSMFRVGVEDLKINLSTMKKVDFFLEDLLEDEDGNEIDIEVTITRSEFEDLIRPMVSRSIQLVDDLLQEMNYDMSMIDDILLVGGTSCIPLVKSMLIDKYGAEKVKSTKKPMLTVAEGAAILANRLDDDYEPEPDVEDGEIIGQIDEIVFAADHDAFVMIQDKNDEWQPDKIIEKQLPLPQISSRNYKTVADNQKLLKIEIKEDVEYGALETTSVSFYAIREDVPKGSTFTFEFEIGTDKLMSLQVFPQGQRHKAKSVTITRDQKDAKAFRTIDDEIQAFNEGDFGIEKRQRFLKIVLSQIDAADSIPGDSPLNDNWSKITYETKEAATKIKEESDDETMDYTIHAQILIGNYSQIMNPIDVDNLRKLVHTVQSNEGAFEATQAQEEIQPIIDRHGLLFDVFFLKIAAQNASKTNPIDAQELNSMHDKIVFNFQNKNPEAAHQILENAYEIANKYLDTKNIGKITTGMSGL